MSLPIYDNACRASEVVQSAWAATYSKSALWIHYYPSSVGRFCCECRDRAEQKRLMRQLNKERRGAMRELRKDAVFLSDEKDKEKAQAKAERAGAFQKNMSFLQQQESDFKSGGQGGMWKKGKGKGKR
jgi:hypothetical protein